ncbi:MAG TPA: YihY/virulence factor BrkB family protein [Flavisolibacter sp.]|jgi:membrane protein|nr:YihY/virulence factor BrkB family protein [Flavisolibacter sp.]
MKRIRTVFSLLKNTAIAFLDDNAFKLSASLSYYTVFALGPLLIIVISLSAIVYGKEVVEGKLVEQLSGLIGADAALQIQNILSNAQQTHASTLGAIIGFIILFIGATGVFTEIQSSINFIWSVRAKPKKSWLKYLLNRLLSFSLIVGLGFVLLVSLVINALLLLLSKKLSEKFPHFPVGLFNLTNSVIILAVITCLFTIIYKILPDAIISWKDAWIGSIFTAALFLLGKFLIGYYLGESNLGVTYGAAASVIIILAWVYYSSLILYFGAEFTKIYALHSGEGIRPKQTAVFIIKKETKEISPSHLDT